LRKTTVPYVAAFHHQSAVFRRRAWLGGDLRPHRHKSRESWQRKARSGPEPPLRWFGSTASRRLQSSSTRFVYCRLLQCPLARGCTPRSNLCVRAQATLFEHVLGRSVLDHCLCKAFMSSAR
jgi:hypothetical protein